MHCIVLSTVRGNVGNNVQLLIIFACFLDFFLFFFPQKALITRGRNQFRLIFGLDEEKIRTKMAEK